MRKGCARGSGGGVENSFQVCSKISCARELEWSLFWSEKFNLQGQ